MAFRYNPGPNKWVADAHGWMARNDWREIEGRQGFWGIPGSTDGPEADGRTDTLFDSAEAALASLGPRPAGPTASENAYNAALRAQGIDPSELPMNSSGQEATARVMQEHGLAIPDYLKAFLGTPAGGGNSATPGAFALPGARVPDGVPGGSFLPSGGGVPAGVADPMQNSIARRFLQRANQDAINAQAQQTRDMIRKILLGGQQQRPMVNPALLRAARGPQAQGA